MPWKTSGDFPSYDKFLVAAYTYMKNVSSALKQPSTLFKEVQGDGSIKYVDRVFPAVTDVSPEDLYKQEDVVKMADLLIQTQVELFKYKNVVNTTKVVSRMRSRVEQSK